MSEGKTALTRQFVEIDGQTSAVSASAAEHNLQYQLLDRKLSSAILKRRTNAIVAPLALQIETLTQSVSELRERISS